MSKLSKILKIILILLFGFSVLKGQEDHHKLEINQLADIQAPLATPIATYFKYGSSTIAFIEKETDNASQNFGSLTLIPATATPLTSISSKLWIDKFGIFRFGNDEVATGWIRNGNLIQLTNPTAEKVVIGSGTGASNLLTVNGQATINAFKMSTNAGANKVLTSDINGKGTWQTIIAGSDNDWTVTGNNMSSIPSGNVGIGTTSPTSKLSVIGDANSDTTLKVENSNDNGIGIYSETTNLNGTRYAGYFKEAGESNEAGGIGYGIYGESTSQYFGYGVYGKSSGTFGAGVYGTTSGSERVAGVYGEATREDPPNTTYGGDFKSAGTYGVGVRGRATKEDEYSDISNIGGSFSASGFYGTGVKGVANGGEGKGVHGKAEGTNAFAGYFEGRSYFKGNVGIGATIPSYMLHVKGSEDSKQIVKFENTSTNSDADGILIDIDNPNPNSGNEYLLFTKDGDVSIGSVSGNGGGVDYNTTSDARLKTNVEDYSNALDALNRIKIKSYERIANPGNKEIGVIAQDLQKVYPQAVTGNPNSDVRTNPMMVDYSKLTPLLVKSIQEQEVKIEKLENDNLNLRYELDLIKSKLKNLTGQLSKARFSKK